VRAIQFTAAVAQDTGVAFAVRFEDFFALEHERLLRALYIITGNRSEAEDLMQDAFVKVLERWDSVQLMDDPTGYLYRTAMNTFRSRYRRGVMALRRMALLEPSQRDPFSDIEIQDDVRRGISGLTPRQRAAIVLTVLLGYTAEDASRIMAIKASTVRALTTQARERLRMALEGTS
jgi:RNA polymerase sigma factor (sigma-70 family)